MSSVLRLLADVLRGVVGDDPALAHQQQPVAAVGLVHHVAGDEDRGAVVGEPVEQRPQVASEHRVEPDRRLVEHQQVGGAEQRHREAGPRQLAAAEPADDLVGVVGRGRPVDDRPVDARRVGARARGRRRRGSRGR